MTTQAILLLLALTSAAVSAAPRKSASILPILECPDPDDNLSPQVILPSVAGLDLATNQYIVCFRGQPFIFNCSEGLFFNWSTMSCDFPYEQRQNPAHGSSSPGGGHSHDHDKTDDIDLDSLVPAGPIPVPISPHLPPVPVWLENNYPFPPGPPPPIHPGLGRPVTKPDPEVLLPIPVLPAHPPPAVPRPVPYFYYY